MFKYLKTNAQLREELAKAENLIARQETRIASLKNEVEFTLGTYIQMRERLTVEDKNNEFLLKEIKRRHDEFERSEYRLRAEIAVLRDKLAASSESKPSVAQAGHGQTLRGGMDSFVTIPKRLPMDEATRAAAVSSPPPVSLPLYDPTLTASITATAMAAAFSDNEAKALGCNTSAPASSYDSPSSCDTGGGSW